MDVSAGPSTDGTTVSTEPEVTTSEPAADPYAGTIFEGQPAWDEPAKVEPTAAEGAPSESEPEAPAPQMHRIKVRGEERELSYEDLIAKAQMGEDYTIKTQEVAEQKRLLSPYMDLYDQLRGPNKAAVLRSLAEQFGVEIPVGNPQAQASNDDDIDSWFTEPSEPTQSDYEQRLAHLEHAEQKRVTDAQTQAHLDTLAGLHEQFGEFDDVELVHYAQRHGHPNLISAYRDLHWDRRPAASQERVSEREDADEAIREQKRAAAVVSGGASKATGSVTEPKASRADLAKMSWDEIGEYTLRQLKLR